MNTQTDELYAVVSHFLIDGKVAAIEPLGNGNINDTYKVTTEESGKPDYVLQRINNSIFTNVDVLQHNIELVTSHIRQKLEALHTDDIDRKVLHFIPTAEKKTYWKTEDGKYWRVMVLIANAKTYEAVTPESSYSAGLTFANFESMLVDVPEKLEEVIPDFHNMELRARQLHEAIEKDAAGRLAEVKDIVDELAKHEHEMCKAERMYREGKLPKRICHCDTKVNNMMFDENDQVLCVIDLDTVMPSFVFSDYGDFLRTGASTAAEDDPDLTKVHFNESIFQAFTRGYLKGAAGFITPIEVENLPFAVALFPYMQCVRFLTDYINGDTYYKIKYPEHNLVRTKNQLVLFRDVLKHTPEIEKFVKSCYEK